MPTLNDVLAEGWKLHQAGELAKAQAIYEGIAQRSPDNANAWCYLGILHFDLRQYPKSEYCYRRAIKVQQRFPIAWSNLGNTLSAMERYTEAVQACETALEQDPSYQTAINNLGAVHVKQNRFDEAAVLFRRALQSKPDNSDAHRNLGAALIRMGDWTEAAKHSQRAVDLNPQDADAHKNLGILSLVRGDFETGWREYQWRFQTGDAVLPKLAQPMWQGEPLEGKSVLLAGEQGLGDIVQFSRYAQILKSCGASRVIVQCQAALHQLMESLEGCDQLIPLGAAVETDYYIPMISVPGVLKTHSVDRIPNHVGYIAAEPTRVTKWSETLDPQQFNVGIVWQGSPQHNADAQRSPPLAAFESLANVPGVQLVSLQKGFGAEQLETVREWGIQRFDDALDNEGAFLDSAALMNSLDLVISSDTSIAHVAGALGVTVWVALCNAPDWRWMLDREDSPWYPTMRLFRQAAPGDWGGVFSRMADALRAIVVESNKGVTRSVSIPGAPGELLDKMTILRIKQRKMNGDALRNVTAELELLDDVRRRTIVERSALLEMEKELQTVNQELWDVEDAIRDCELQQEFGDVFIQLARSVYRLNDQRAKLKRQINDLLGSKIVEEKSYADYEKP